MRRFGLYAALALCVCGLPATAADQYGQWSLERLHSNVVTLTYTQSIPRDDNDVRTAELGFICIQKKMDQELLVRRYCRLREVMRTRKTR
jgi:hypothetical protein